MVVALHVALDVFRANNDRSRMTTQIPVDDLPVQLGLAVSVLNRYHGRDSGLPCRQTPVEVGMVEMAVHQIDALSPNKIDQGRHYAPIHSSLVHEAQLDQRNIHAGQPVAHHPTLAYAAYDRRKTLVRQPAHNAQQKIFGTANRERDKEMKYPSLAVQCGFADHAPERKFHVSSTPDSKGTRGVHPETSLSLALSRMFADTSNPRCSSTRSSMRRPCVDASGSIVLSTSRLDFPTPVPML